MNAGRISLTATTFVGLHDFPVHRFVHSLHSTTATSGSLYDGPPLHIALSMGVSGNRTILKDLQPT